MPGRRAFYKSTHKENCMKNTIKLIGIIAVAVIIGFSMAACDNNGGGGGIPAELVAAWYSDANGNGIVDGVEGIVAIYDFKSDGKLVVSGADTGLIFSVSGDKITLQGLTDSITFKIEGKKMTLSGSTASGFLPGAYAKK
jgi:hypothetical protein